MFSNKDMKKVKTFNSENQALAYLCKLQEDRKETRHEGEECRGTTPVNGYVVMSEEEFN